MAVELVRATDESVWHRTDILGCSRTSTLEMTDDSESREVDSGDWPDDRCPNCTW
jgi:hypothetical protein